MTRVLSELLGAREPTFRLGLQQLEKSAGRPNADIRLSTEVLQGMQAKLRELGLDPHDTHGRELHAALGARLRADEQKFAAALTGKSTKTDDPIAYVAKGLERVLVPKTCFALKNTVAKRLIKANPPKRAMKALGYRSVDSMLKHEAVSYLYAAAMLVETEGWMKKQIAGYAKLKAGDFEIRKVAIEHPTSKRWIALAETAVAARRHNIFGFKELGAVVLLPLPNERPDLPTLTTAVLAIHELNEILATSTFLKLHQVQSHFGAVVKEVVAGEPTLGTILLDEPVSWNMVQRFYSRFKAMIRSEIFEPVVQAEDLVWHKAEDVLASIEPSLAFWQGTSHLGIVSGRDTVACNLTDQILSHCNNVPFERCSLSYFRHELMQELALRYMDAERIEQAISNKFQRRLSTATEPVVV
jgi:hypothetical protein